MGNLNILGLIYEVERVPYVCRDEYRLGQIDFVSQKISIDESISLEKAHVVLLHEILHGIFEGLGFNEECQNESMIQGLATALHQCLIANPEIMKGDLLHAK